MFVPVAPYYINILKIAFMRPDVVKQQMKETDTAGNSRDIDDEEVPVVRIVMLGDADDGGITIYNYPVHEVAAAFNKVADVFVLVGDSYVNALNVSLLRESTIKPDKQSIPVVDIEIRGGDTLCGIRVENHTVEGIAKVLNAGLERYYQYQAAYWIPPED